MTESRRGEVANVFAEALATVETNPNYRVLRRFVPQTVYAEEQWNAGDPDPSRLGVFVDVESTGLDTDVDEIIELGMVPFTFNPESGLIYEVRDPIMYFEEPTLKITPEIVEITGITPEMVAGQKIDSAHVNAVVEDAALVIAHSARFDRKMIERRLSGFTNKYWACSQEEVPWRRFGVAGGALANAAMTACGVFTDGAHRAAHDCQLGIHVLATAECEGRTAMSYLLESARQPTYRVRALGSPRESKDILKRRGYRALYTGGQFQYWYRDLRLNGDNVAEEEGWCQRNAWCTPDVVKLTGKDRYSRRAG